MIVFINNYYIEEVMVWVLKNGTIKDRLLLYLNQKMKNLDDIQMLIGIHQEKKLYIKKDLLSFLSIKIKNISIVTKKDIQSFYIKAMS